MMKWFEGSIADAVTASKARNAVFVVYIEGPDEMSTNMSKAMDSGGISSELASSRFVCIKLTKDSESHRQFTEIYKIVPVPSLFFIGENGVPLEIVASDKSLENVTKKIISAISNIKGEPVETPTKQPDTSDEEAPSTSALPDLGPARDARVSSPGNTAMTETEVVTPVFTTPALEQSPSNDNKKKEEMERVQEIIKKNREINEKLEAEKEKDRELARRQMGKEINLARKSQQERELDELRREREKEKKLEAEARQRVLRQIEDDKANRVAKMAAQQIDQPKISEEASPVIQRRQANEARIQFKLPDGQSRTQTFPANTTLRDLRSFVDSNIKIPFPEYTLATTFPRREFSSRDLDRDLASLELFPSSVILILPVQGNISIMRVGWTATFTAMLWSLIQPVLNIGSYLSSLISGRREPDATSSTDPTTTATSTAAASESLPQPSSQDQHPTRPPYFAQVGGGRSVRKRGNVHTLSDGNDSNDENNTWNGNSTQLM